MATIARTVKRLIRAAAGQDFFEKPDLKCRTERFGSALGGWDLVPDGLGPGSVVYSFGVGDDASFDLALIERFGVTVHAFDPTPKSIAWVRRQQLPAAFVLHEYGIAATDGTVTFYPPENPAHVSHTVLDRPATQHRAITVPVKRLASIMAALGHAHLDLLKMDVEGAEYAVIDDLAASAIRPRQLLLEFHHRFPNVGIAKSRQAIARLRGLGYRLFAISGSGEEYGFLHRAA